MTAQSLFDRPIEDLGDVEINLLAGVVIASAAFTKGAVRRDPTSYVELVSRKGPVLARGNDRQGFVQFSPLTDRGQAEALLSCFADASTKEEGGRFSCSVRIKSRQVEETAAGDCPERAITMACVRAFVKAYGEDWRS